MTEDFYERFAVVDLFCGVGGLSFGLSSQGLQVHAGVDADPSCEHAFKTNVGADFRLKKIQDFSDSELLELFPENKERILVGCAPCQPFSAYVAGAKKKSTDRWKLLSELKRAVEVTKPLVFSMENVPRLRSFDDGKVFNKFLEGLSEDYDISHTVVNCAEYGVPQTRRRLVVLGSKLSRIELVSPTHNPTDLTVRDAIENLPTLQHGTADPADRIHMSPRLSERNLKRIRASSPGGTWEDWPTSLQAKCHQKASGSGYKNVYGRMAWDSLAPTITTGCFSFGRGRFGHPKQDRAISLREAALLQTFPPDYDFVPEEEEVSFATLGRHIGNAVPVSLAEAIAQTIKLHLEQHYNGRI